MTATRDRQSDSQSDPTAVEAWGERSVFGTARGWPWWAAVVLALVLSMVGAFIDMHTSGSIGKVFEGAYFLGCVAAVCAVRRRNLFGPMVQAPLILAVTIPVIVLVTKGMPSGSSTMSKLITLGVPLVTGFPVMANTTAATVVIGGIRFLVQRKPVEDGDDDRGDRPEPPRRRPADRDGDRDRGSRRPSSGSSGRPRPARDDQGGSRDRGRSPSQSSRSRGESPERRERSSGGRSGSGQSRERGQSPRSGQGRDRGQAPRGGRSSRDGERRQPPRRRDDDY
ncbi:MAG TPA: DUF6542 domain-containing protein [Pseudonocardiaceae bacterium]|nr:DUF6542 domain-containing protein [Pseudonocardiaceae bacterium]